MNKELLENIKDHLSDKNSRRVIAEVVSVLDVKRDLVLPAVLKSKLDTVKNNPLEATEVYQMQEEITKNIADEEIDISETPIELLEAIMTSGELTKLAKDGVTLEEFMKLGNAISEKVFGLKYLNDKDKLVYKEPESHKEMAVLSFYERKEIRRLNKKITSIGNKITKKRTEAYIIFEGEGTSEEKNKKSNVLLSDINGLGEDAKILAKERDETSLKYSGLDKKNFTTKWEEDLAIVKVIDMASDLYTPPMGKK